MKISIIKPGMPIILPADRIDTSNFGGMSEVYGLCDILSQQHDVVLDKVVGDALIVVNAYPRNQDELAIIKQFSGRKFQEITDLTIVYTAEEIGEFESLMQAPTSKNYIGSEKYTLKYVSPKSREKTLQFLYAGGTRHGKRDKYFRMYLDPAKDFVTKIVTSSKLQMFNHPKVQQKILFRDLIELYTHVKYSLVIGDPEYNEIGMITPRYWEYLLFDIIAFMDKDFDCAASLMTADDFRRVGSAEELEEKIKYLEKEQQVCEKILIKQQEQLFVERSAEKIRQNDELLRKVINL